MAETHPFSVPGPPTKPAPPDGAPPGLLKQTAEGQEKTSLDVVPPESVPDWMEHLLKRQQEQQQNLVQTLSEKLDGHASSLTVQISAMKAELNGSFAEVLARLGQSNGLQHHTSTQDTVDTLVLDGQRMILPTRRSSLNAGHTPFPSTSLAAVREPDAVQPLPPSVDAPSSILKGERGSTILKPDPRSSKKGSLTSSRGGSFAFASPGTVLEFELHDCWKEVGPVSDAVRDCNDNPLRNGAAGSAEMRRLQYRKGLKEGKTRDFTADKAASEHLQTKETMVYGKSAWERKAVINPNSPARFCWDLVSLVLIAFDIVTIPLQFFSLAIPLWIQVITCLFWTLDCGFGFFLGYYEHGILEMRLKYTVRHYMTTWMPFDIVLVVTDWIVIAQHGQTKDNHSKMARIGKSLRIVRTLRSLRLLRLVKMKRLMEQLKDRLVSDVSRTFLTVFSLICIIVSINHVIACAWYGIGDHHMLLGYPNWVERFGFNETHFDYTYATALHWSLTQFTPATMEVFPQNTSERVYCIGVLLFALVVFSTFVSSLTSSMTRLQTMRSERDRQFEMLRRFLRDMEVSHFLAVRVQRYLEHFVSVKRKRIEMKDVALLEMLSGPLRMDLDMEIFSPALSSHSFFQHYCTQDGGAMRRICSAALSRNFLCAGDSLFNSGDPCNQMYFVLDGNLKYKAADSDVDEKLRKYAQSKENQFMQEQYSQHAKPRASILGTPMQKQQSRTSSRRETVNRESGQFKMIKFASSKPAEHDPAAFVDEDEEDEGERHLYLSPGDWCCEPALWTKWSHQGVMRATTICDILVMSAEQFAAVTSTHGRIAPCAATYGRAFVTQLNNMAARGILSDLPIMDPEPLIHEAFFGQTSSNRMTTMATLDEP